MITEQEAREAEKRRLIVAIGNGNDSIEARLLAAIVLEELDRRERERAERDRPIDAEWLSTCKPDLMFWQKTSEFIEYEFRHQPQPGALKVVVNANGHVGFVVNKSLAACLTTRGQLLDLISALKGGA